MQVHKLQDMAPSLFPCIENGFCSHRQASRFLLVTLIPFFFPILILCLPFLLLILAPLSSLLFSLLLLYKLQVFIWARHPSLRGKGGFRQRSGLVETSSLEGGKYRVLQGPDEELEGENVQRTGASEAKDVGDFLTTPSGNDVTEGEPSGVEELAAKEGDAPSGVEELDAKDDLKEEEMEWLPDNEVEAQSELNREQEQYDLKGFQVLAPPSSRESPIHHSKEEQVIMTKEMPSDQDQEDMHHTKVEQAITEDECLQGLASSSTEGPTRHNKEEQVITEDEGLQVLPSSSTDSPISHTKEEQAITTKEMPSEQMEGIHHTKEQASTMKETPLDQEEDIHHKKDEQAIMEDEGLQVPASSGRESPIHLTKEEQGVAMRETPSDQEENRMKGQQEEMGGGPQEEMGGVFQDKHLISLPPTQEHETLQALSEDWPHSVPKEEEDNVFGRKDHDEVGQFHEVPWKDAGGETVEIDTHQKHFDEQEHGRQDAAELSEKKSGSTLVDFGLGEPQRLPSVENEVEEGEASCSSADVIEQRRAAEELQEDVQPRQGMQMSDVERSSQSASPEQDHLFEASSSTTSPPQRPLKDVESQDKLHEERKILADIYAIMKIVGYEGETHASMMEQISALYMFLGMEPYEWDVKVEDFERARAEVELLKVVVGVK